MAGFQSLIEFLADGEAVNAGVTNRPTKSLSGNIDYLKDLIESALLGSTVFARDKTVEIDAQVGMAVYYNASTQQYERALAATDSDLTTGEIVPAASAHVWGVVYRKLNSTKADILLFGSVTLDLDEAVDGSIVAGVYYLSGAEPGKLTQTRQPVSIPVLLSDGDGMVFVNPRTFESLDAHRHYRFELVARPAGQHAAPDVGDRHVITYDDDTIEGWLPASNPLFGGKAPANAAFGYNISASVLKNMWPPVPLSGAYLEWNKGTDKDVSGTGVPLGASGLAIIDANGIWWLSDCYGDVPWPATLDTAAESSVSTSMSEVECPRNLAMSVTLWFTRMTFHTANSAVLSLVAAEGSHLRIRCVTDGSEASTGHLEITDDLSLLITNDSKEGHLAFKTLDPETGEIERGPVVEGLRAGSSNVTLTSNLGVPDDGLFQGEVTITADTEVDGKELTVKVVRLDAVTEEYYQGVLGLGFPQGAAAEFRGQIDVPAQNVLPTGTLLKLRFRLLGRAAGTLPAFTLSYRRITRPTAVLTDHVALPTSDTLLTIDTTTTVTADQYMEAESDTIEVAAGDVVLFTLGRADDDAYLGEIHVLQQAGVLVTP